MSGRKRTCCIKVRLTPEELNQLNEDSKCCGLSRESYLRLLMKKVNPVPLPSKELVECISQIRHIGNNINQISYVANCSNNIDTPYFKECYEQYENVINELMIKINKTETIEV